MRVLPAGTVLVVVRGMILAHSFPVAVTEVPVTINQDMKALTSRHDLAQIFLYWCLVGLGKRLVSLCDESAHGTRKLETATLGSLPIPLPPLAEQEAIAGFLDRETGRIDKLVAKKRLLLERLQEYRTALITRTVTRGLPPEAARAAGLDPSPCLKPSGVEWLGHIPEHWDIDPLRRRAAIVNGGTPASGDNTFWDGETVWLTPDDLGRNEGLLIRESRRRITEEGVRNSSAQVSPPSSIVLSTRAPIGHLASRRCQPRRTRDAARSSPIHEPTIALHTTRF